MSEGLITVQELMQRWHIEAATEAARAKAFRRRCAKWGLRPLSGTRGAGQLFRPADVARAEARAAGARW